MNVIARQVRELVDVELAAANERFPQFHSAHEGYAVILEELQELQLETEYAAKNLDQAWENIKENRAKRTITDIDWTMKSAMKAACEAIQVAAMCQKFLNMEAQE